MTYLLIFIIIMFFVGYLLSRYWPHLLMWFVKRQYNKARKDAEQGYRRRAQSQQRQQPRRGKTKIYSREEGEYVEFEDIPTYNNGQQQDTTEIKYTSESQITDVEWEDL